MPEFLQTALQSGGGVEPWEVLVRLLVALVLGVVVAWVYRRTRRSAEVSPSFPVTLVLLSVLIAMVTQVIGDNVARAFSLVGALSIVRFRTVVRDTQDTAYVIFAVVVGMAVGSSDLWVSVIGIGVVSLAAFLTIRTRTAVAETRLGFLLELRLGLGHDLEALVGHVLDEYLEDRDLVCVETARQGQLLEFTYETRMRAGRTADGFVRALHGVAGVQSVQLKRRGFEA
jgi:energy-converting hydrogenase Eha subunit A